MKNRVIYFIFHREEVCKRHMCEQCIFSVASRQRNTRYTRYASSIKTQKKWFYKQLGRFTRTTRTWK